MAAPPMPLPPLPMGGMGPGRSSSTSMPPSNVVLLTNVPQFLHSCLGHWISPCGPARTILWYPKQLSDDDDDKDASKKKSMALVTMMHGDGAWKLVHSISSSKEFRGMIAQLVPASPDIPLPPIRLEESVAAPLQTMMLAKFEELSKSNGKIGGAGGAPKTAAVPPPSQQPMDTQKVAAAAGGTYDEDVDPLNAPAVLQAVKDFRKSLQKTSTVQQARRVQLVKEKLKEAMERIKSGPSPAAVAAAAVPPPPLPTGGLPPPPPPPSGLPPLGGLPPPPPAAAEDSGKRGQSNLPAWMTKDNKEDEGGPPPTKKQKKALNPEALRTFVAAQIKNLMGEEEATLIKFIVDHVVEEKPMPALVEELKQVLDEDTNEFLVALQKKLEELTTA